MTDIILIIIVFRIGIIPNWIGFIFAIYCFVPFFLNDFLFPARYMGDQFYYLNMMKEVRSLNILPDLNYNNSIKALSTSWRLSVLPLPYVETVKSIGFFNRFLFFITFCWLDNKKFLSGMPLLLLLFYPSLILYTSLSLRDPPFYVMLVSIILMIDKKYIKFFIIIIPLYFLKFQNFYFILILFLIFVIFNNKYSLKKYGLLFSIISIILIISFNSEIISHLDLYRLGMYNSDGGDLALYVPLNNLFDAFVKSLLAFPYFMMKPFPWEAENTFQLIQSLENIFLLVFLYIFTKQTFNESKFITIRWLFYSIFVMTIYGLVVYNFGTAVRYKFIFIILYVVGLSYELYKVKNHKINFR